jgi:hypothetical protein
MKSIKMFGLAALAALMAMAFVGATSAMASTTSLCPADTAGMAEEPCNITHVHETSVVKATLLNSLTNVTCNVLFLGDVEAGTSNPLVIKGNFTYSGCNNFCSVSEENGPSKLKVLRTATELGEVTGEGLVHLNCPFLNCTYTGTGLNGHALGPLTSSNANGGVIITGQTTTKESGAVCPETAKLDIETTPLVATYLGGQELGHYCVKYERAIGFYLNVNGSKKSECIEKDEKRLGNYGLVLGPAGVAAGTMVCVNLSEKVGLYKKISSTGEKCEEDDATNKSLYELGTIQ